MADDGQQPSNTTRPLESVKTGEPPVDMVKDWSEDYFPTSARPIFISVGIMVLGIVGLCVAVYLLSEHPSDPEKLKRQEAIKERMKIDEDE